MMTCSACGKEILWNEPHEMIGVDGDFIHSKCRALWVKQCAEINNMSDEEFRDWLFGKPLGLD